jgi:hypothetical protein
MELPYNFVAKTTAKAAQVMANFNALKNAVTTIEDTLSTGVTKIAAGAVGTAQIAAGAVAAAQIAAGAVGKAQLAAGFNQKRSAGNSAAEIPPGGLYSFLTAVAHGLGETPTVVNLTTSAPHEYALTFEPRLIAKDPTFFWYDVHCSSGIPGGGNFVCGVGWEAIGA